MKAYLLALVLLGLFIWSRVNHATEVARAAELEQRADSFYLRALNSEQALDAVMAQENTIIDVLSASRDSALTRAVRAEGRRPTIIDRVVVRAGPDSAAVRVAVQEVADSIVAYELTPLKVALAASDSIRQSVTRQRDAALVANHELRIALEASRTEARAWERAARPELFGLFHVDPGPALVIGLAAGLAIGLR